MRSTYLQQRAAGLNEGTSLCCSPCCETAEIPLGFVGFFAEDSLAKAAGRETRKGWTLQHDNFALVVLGLFRRPCWPLYPRTDVSPGSGMETGRDSIVSKEVVPGCRRNWGFFVPPLSLTVVKIQ